MLAGVAADLGVLASNIERSHLATSSIEEVYPREGRTKMWLLWASVLVALLASALARSTGK